MPSDYFKSFLPKLFRSGSQQPTDSDGFVIVDCEKITLMPVVKLLFGGFWLELLPAHYITKGANNTCRL
jgi:hypothetical protein